MSVFLWFGVVRLGSVPQLLGIGGVPSVVGRGQFAGWVQLNVVRVEDHVLLELEVRGSVGLGALVMSKRVVVKRWSAGPGIRGLGFWLRVVFVHVVFSRWGWGSSLCILCLSMG